MPSKITNVNTLKILDEIERAMEYLKSHHGHNKNQVAAIIGIDYGNLSGHFNGTKYIGLKAAKKLKENLYSLLANDLVDFIPKTKGSKADYKAPSQIGDTQSGSGHSDLEARVFSLEVLVTRQRQALTQLQAEVEKLRDLLIQKNNPE